MITRHVPTSIVQIGLKEQLRASGVTNVILAGFITRICVNSTAHGLFNMSVRPMVIAVATVMTHDPPDADGRVVPAAAFQVASLTGLRDLFAIVVRTSDEVVD